MTAARVTLGAAIAIALLHAAPARAQLSPAFTNPTTGVAAQTGDVISLSQVQGFMAAKRDAALFPTPLDTLTTSSAMAAMQNGAVDATAAIQTAWAKGGVRLPCGTYLLKGLLVAPASNTALLGEGEGCTRVLVTSAAGDVITIPSGIGNVHIEGIQFLAQVARTSGALVHIRGSGAVIDDVHVEGSGGSFFDGVLVDGTAVTHVQNFYMASATNTCLRLINRTVDTYIVNGNTSACATGIDLRSASGIYLGLLDLVGSGASGLVVDPVASNGDSVDAFYGNTVLSDTSSGVDVIFAGTGRITEVNIANLWASAAGTSGVFTANQVLNQPSDGIQINNPLLNGMTLSAPRAKGNGAHGFHLIAGQNIQLIAPQALMNGASYGVAPPGGSALSTTRYDGIHIGGAVTNLSIVAPIAGPGGWEAGAGLTMKQGWGLYREADVNSQVVTVTLMGGQFPNNVTGGYQLNAASSDHIVDLGNQAY